MAAELIVTLSIEEALKKASSIAAEGIRLACGFEGPLQKLNQSLTMIKYVLQDAARRPVTGNSVKQWLHNVQDVAYDADDVLDKVNYEILRREQQVRTGFDKVCDFVSHNPIPFNHMMDREFKKINEALDDIWKVAAGINLVSTSLHVDGAPEVTQYEERQTDSDLDTVVVGREDDVSKVMKLLIGSIDQQISKSEVLNPKKDSAVDGGSHIRHLNLISRGDVEAVFAKIDARKLRTVFSMVDVFNGSWKFKSLRTLKLRRSDITELPDSICKLIYLRYLDVSDTAIRALPESITELYHLETLRFTDCKSLKKLPKKMRNLVSLRHLYFDDPKLVPAEVRLLTRLQTLPFFVVGPDHMVEELGCLKELRGALKICKLEQVRDREEAEKAKLREKRMNKLVFKWSGGEGNSNVNSEDVLEGLQPPPDIRSLTIEGYGGENFSSWILQLDNLTVLRLNGCSKLTQLPTLGCLPRLKILEMSGMPNVKCIGKEFYSSSSGSAAELFPALEELTLRGMDGLKEWMGPGGEVVAVFPRLERLSIWNCGKLESIPRCCLSSLVEFKILGCDELRYFSGEFDGFKSLQILSIVECPKLESIPSVQHCTTLVQLHIYKCRELISIPGDFRELNSLKKLTVSGCKLGALPSGLQCCASLEQLYIIDWSELIHISDLQELSSLRSLTILRCDKLISIDWHGLRQLSSLVYLSISGCPSLSDSPEDDCLGGLTQLKLLSIGGFSKEMEAFPAGVLNSFQHLNLSGSLKTLWIDGWDKLKSVPHQLQHLTALTSLSIRDFNGEEFEEALPEWLANLSSLQRLDIINCKNVKYMPSSTAMQHLSKLKLLYIWYCPHLSENCRKENGSEWPKVSHIPDIFIR
uniref:Fom-2 family protein n=1 Tax=Populus alba TaxID=43335 RepID=A0A4U5NAI5_POPAL|nr:Fom-2 family protein [Populus alba]